jgi:hypothetical protein
LILTLKSKLIKKNRYFTKLLKKNILLYIFWYRKIRHFEITTIYNYILEGYDWIKSAKITSNNIAGFIWQMNRYGFMLYYYYPMSLNYIYYNKIKTNFIKIFNIYNLVFYSKKKKNK